MVRIAAPDSLTYLSMTRSPQTRPPRHEASLAERVRSARRAAGLSQDALATKLGIRRAAVTQWEQPAGTQPSVLNLRQTAMETSVSFEWLATGRGPMQPASDEVPAFSTDCIARGSDEEHLLAGYRRLTSRQREALLAFIKTLSK